MKCPCCDYDQLPQEITDEDEAVLRCPWCCPADKPPCAHAERIISDRDDHIEDKS